jgi:signal transduction histidine kinase
MFHRGFFLKIYLCFGLTIILVVSIQIALDHFDESGPFSRMKRYVASTLSLYGQAIVAYHLAGNLEAAVHLTERLKKDTGIDGYLLDDGLKKLDGSPESAKIKEIAANALQLGEPNHVVDSKVGVLVVPFITPEEKQYVAIGKFNTGGFVPPEPIFGNPNMGLRIAIILLIPGAVCFFFTRYLVAPLRILREATTKFAVGHYSLRISSRMGCRKDEITDLAKDFDEMAERIESLMKLQKQLIGDISHELRSPLARLNVALDLAKQKAGGEVEHNLNRIEEEAEEMNHMIGELLTLTRLESGSNTIESSSFDIFWLVSEIAEDCDFEAQGSSRGVVLREGDACVVYGNRELLGRAIENVVRNAIHYTYENTNVEIVVNEHSGNVHITVKDHGPGVCESELSNIFRPFFRTSASRERHTGGSGLGLAISERAVMFHHGTISAENSSDGGLVVRISIPSTPEATQ